MDAAIASNPMNRNELLLGGHDLNCPLGATNAFYISTDGGTNWTRTLCMHNVAFGNNAYYPAASPMVGYDLKGQAYAAGEYFDSKGIGLGLVLVQKSTDGVNWSERLALALGGTFGGFYYSWLTIDTSPESPFANSLYISSRGVQEPYQQGMKVFVSHSHDGGHHWKAVPVDGIQFYPALDPFTNVVTGKDGTVYVTWEHCPGTGPNADCKNGKGYMLFSKSTDGGDTWTSPTVMTTVQTDCSCASGFFPNTNVGVSEDPVIGVDKSSGPYSGNLYVTMFNWTGTQLQVEVTRSTDGGNTWSAPVPVAPPSDTHDQAFPWLSVSSTGLVGLSWLDRRNDQANVNYQAFAAISRDGGQTFQPNIQLTTGFSNPDIGNETYMGDYTGNTWVGPNFIAAWMDSSNGVSMQDVVGGVKLH